MKTFTGTAKEVTYSGFASGFQGELHVEVVTFLLDGSQSVRFHSGDRARIADGDRVALVGNVWGDELWVLAYRNLTTGASGNVGRWDFVLFGVFLLVMHFVMSDIFSTPLCLIVWALSVLKAIRVTIAERKLARDVSRHHRPTEGPAGAPLGES